MSETASKSVHVGDFDIAKGNALTIIAGPCQLESAEHSQMIAGRVAEMCEKFGLNYIFKGSFDKANRSSITTKRGLGVAEGLKVLGGVRDACGMPVLTDIHTAEQCEEVGSVVDVLQIPAFLCRQTDLLLAAGETGRAINVKKGQFLAPWDMGNVAAKIASTGNEKILLCDRGTSFGYNTLVTDFRGLPIMERSGYPIVFDATHSVQQPGGQGTTSGGQREFVPVLARAAVSIGVSAVFIETHEDPDRAPSDGPNMVPLDKLEALLTELSEFHALANRHPLTV
ncbi:MAG: 3-deoxy-8-phosphooctulonate synthase [Pseudomonadota bacterium]